MREISDPEYEKLKKFFSWACDNWPLAHEGPREGHPFVIFTAAEKTLTRSQLMSGLKQTIGDALEYF